MSGLLDNFTPALARCHQRHLPIVDAVGRPLRAGTPVRFRRRNEGAPPTGQILFLFDFVDFAPPEIEVQTERGIFTVLSRLTGGCWKFDRLLAADQGEGDRG